MTATYWEIGRRIIEFEQRGATRAEYGAALLEKLSADLTAAIRPGLFASQLAAFPGVLSPVPAEADSLDTVERIALQDTADDSLEARGLRRQANGDS